ncbi:MAG: 3-methyladenine DNA glycosylase [Phycisphaerae bacterium]|nr:3-methyladenine DNA glycosylase [Phycisphaerae bacterium]|tara:strand:+ start:2197 stop:2835 length:639 start_codon:yes stop_codon:yes gene_type:complete
MRRRAFGGEAIEVAISLLGQRLVRSHHGHRLVGRIVEVEAYLGPQDLASHSAGGRRTNRNESMFLGGGHVYVYLIYGMHHCVNVTTGKQGSGAAVLIRAIEPLEGVDVMEQHRTTCRSMIDLGRGPGRLCQAMAIDRSLDGEDLRTSSQIWIERASRIPLAEIVAGSRIGIGKAGRWKSAPLRFAVRENRHVSRPVPSKKAVAALEWHEITM